MSNRLGGETSPYLLQHKDNPVHWWPWSSEALAVASATGKPILLSIGYAACHWCHVMAHESFEDTDIASVMNALFINIKVDREERPDLDAIYQAALSMLGQQGGWPLTMFLTPGGEPFWGGTYFPSTPRYGRPGFPEILRAVSQAWSEQGEGVTHNIAALRDGLADHYKVAPGPLPAPSMLDHFCSAIARMADRQEGGLQGAPKFPMPFLFDFLWRGFLRTGDEDLKNVVLLTLDKMSQGGIYDHLGGGYARYSTDAFWLAPHFEKMLYDNAQIVSLLTLVWQKIPSDLYRERIQETITWLLREMMGEGDAFAATLDADSEGEEGKFYVWAENEIDCLLSETDRALFKRVYDVTSAGNWEGHTILRRQGTLLDQNTENKLDALRSILLQSRESRIRPGRDDKILADWNGMMIAALAEAAFAFHQPRWLIAAQTAFATIHRDLSIGTRLVHSRRLGRLQNEAMLDDYANMARAALSLFEITGENTYLDRARDWVATADHYYWDDLAGGYFMSASDAGDVVVRAKTATDSATPSGNGIMVQVLARLHYLTGEDRYRERAEATVAAFCGTIERTFANMTSLLAGYETLIAADQIAILADRADPATQDLLSVIGRTALPNRILTVVPAGTSLPENHPAFGKVQIDGRPTAYVCRGQTCSLPVTDADALRAMLQPR